MRKVVLRIIVPLFVFGSAFIIPVYGVQFEISDLIVVISLLFAILLGFFIATATANYLDFQARLAEEGEALIMIFSFGRLVQPGAARKLADAIDRYLIATLDFSLTEYVQKTETEFEALMGTVDGLEPKKNDARGESALDHVYDEKSGLLKARSAISFTAPRVTTAVHWLVIILLTGALTSLLFSLRDGSLFLAAIVGVLSAALYLILLVLYEVDGNIFLEEQLAYGDVQSIFRAIGKPQYYPAFVIENGIAPAPLEDYRIGVYKDYPRSTEKTVQAVRVNERLRGLKK